MQLHIHYLSLLMLKFFFADVDHVNEGLVKRKKMRESKDFRRKTKIESGS